MTHQVITVQSLLREVRQLSLKDQFHLATQILQVIDQQLEKPEPNRRSSANYRLAAVNPALVRDSSTEQGSGNIDASQQEITISYLLENPIPVHNNFKPLSRDEIYD
jgi:hypothetical protein